MERGLLLKGTFLKNTMTRSLLVAAMLGSFLAGTMPAQANTATFGISITKKPTANITLSTATFTWANITDSSNTSLAADNNPASANVTGTLITTYSSGSGQLNVSAPANITGTAGGTLPINALQITCSGSAVAGQTFNASSATALTATPTPCARRTPQDTTHRSRSSSACSWTIPASRSTPIRAPRASDWSPARPSAIV